MAAIRETRFGEHWLADAGLGRRGGLRVRSALRLVPEHLEVGDPFAGHPAQRSTSRSAARATARRMDLPARSSTGQDSCRQPAKIIVAGHCYLLSLSSSSR